MGRPLTPDRNMLYTRTDEVLHYIWDPCGVAGCPQARDEYYSYLPQVFALLEGSADEAAITDYLVGVERDSMGLFPNRERVRQVAAVLVDYRETIREKASQ